MSTSAIRARTLLARAEDASGLLLFSVIALNILLVATAFVLAHYFGKDVISSLTQFPVDGTGCDPAVQGVGVHCFNDYASVREAVLTDDPWGYSNGRGSNYPAAGILPHLAFSEFGVLVGSARAGLLGYLLMLVIALAVPAMWASKGKAAWVRLMAVGAFGILSVPGLMVLDRGNSTGLLAPVLLAFLVCVRRGNFKGAAIATVVATMVKPQMILLLVLFPAIRKWRLAFLTGAWIVITNLAAYLVWPSHFPRTLIETLKNVAHYGGVSLAYEHPANTSFPEALHGLEVSIRRIMGLQIEHTRVDQHQSFVGVGVAGIICVILFVLARRIPPHFTAIILVATASLFPPVNWSYYLVFCLPVAAVLLRDPLDRAPDGSRWHGLLDDPDRPSVLQRLSTLLLIAATAASVSRVLFASVAHVPGWGESGSVVKTSGEFGVLLWLVAIVVTMFAYSRRDTPSPQKAPAPSGGRSKGGK